MILKVVKKKSFYGKYFNFVKREGNIIFYE